MRSVPQGGSEALICEDPDECRVILLEHVLRKLSGAIMVPLDLPMHYCDELRSAA